MSKPQDAIASCEWDHTTPDAMQLVSKDDSERTYECPKCRGVFNFTEADLWPYPLRGTVNPGWDRP
jgi:hypothetical protein